MLGTPDRDASSWRLILCHADISHLRGTSSVNRFYLEMKSFGVGLHLRFHFTWLKLGVTQPWFLPPDNSAWSTLGVGLAKTNSREGLGTQESRSVSTDRDTSTTRRSQLVPSMHSLHVKGTLIQVIKNSVFRTIFPAPMNWLFIKIDWWSNGGLSHSFCPRNEWSPVALL